MRSLMVSILSVVLVFFLSCACQASDGAPPTDPAKQKPMLKCEERFDALDTNHDGVVTKEEFMAQGHPGGRGEEVFTSRDGDGDGKLTREEFCSGKGRHKGRRGQ
jgi:hypothetical protein